eukprot:TRINITY_DN8352_c0_g1_i1.p1 TRINITY_DN8352_c0_g1~~TRINITY_DN8352_c0_g1_i1.p1  ORF type:complete len:689 (-),score=148.40 TRINITY_DN8352_c0_g1_i1:84-2117(-)
MSNFSEQYPDISKSVYDAVISQTGTKAAEHFANFAQKIDPKIAQDRINEGHQMFPDLELTVIHKVLEEHNWSLESALGPFVELVVKKRNAIEVETTAKFYEEKIMASMTREQFHQIIEENEGDIESSVVQIATQFENEIQHQNQKQKEEIEQERKVNAFHKKFSDVLSRIQVLNALKNNNWKVQETATRLFSEAEQIKKQQLINKFGSSFTEEELVEVLEKRNWQTVAAIQDLTRLRRENHDAKKLKEVRSKLEESFAKLKQTKEVRIKKLAAEIDHEVNLKSPLREPEVINKLVGRLGTALRTTAVNPDEHTINQSMVVTPNVDDPVNITGPPSTTEQTVAEPSSPPTSGPPPPPPPPVKPVTPSPPSPLVGEFKLDSSPPPAVLLKAEPAIADYNEPVTVHWTVKSEVPFEGYYWIAMFPASEENPRNYLSYLWTKPNSESGEVVFMVPRTYYGEVRFKLLKASSYDVLITSNAIKLGPTYTLKARLERDDASSSLRKVRVTCKQVSGVQRPNAWLALYPSSDVPHKKYHSYQWLSSATDGVLEFQVPKDGDWEIRLISNRSLFRSNYLCVARVGVSVTGHDSLELVRAGNVTTVKYNLQTIDPISDQAWIGLYLVQETDYLHQYRRYKYISSPGRSDITFKTPIHGGIYVAHLFAKKSGVPVVTSNPLPVPDSD